MSDQYETTRCMEGNKQVMTWKKLTNILFSMGIGSRARRKQDYVLYTFAYSSSSQTLGCTNMT